MCEVSCERVIHFFYTLCRTLASPHSVSKITHTINFILFCFFNTDSIKCRKLGTKDISLFFRTECEVNRDLVCCIASGLRISKQFSLFYLFFLLYFFYFIYFFFYFIYFFILFIFLFFLFYFFLFYLFFVCFNEQIGSTDR